MIWGKHSITDMHIGLGLITIVFSLRYRYVQLGNRH